MTAWDMARLASKRPLRKPYKAVGPVGEHPACPCPTMLDRYSLERRDFHACEDCGYHVCSCEPAAPEQCETAPGIKMDGGWVLPFAQCAIKTTPYVRLGTASVIGRGPKHPGLYYLVCHPTEVDDVKRKLGWPKADVYFATTEQAQAAMQSDMQPVLTLPMYAARMRGQSLDHAVINESGMLSELRKDLGLDHNQARSVFNDALDQKIDALVKHPSAKLYMGMDVGVSESVSSGETYVFATDGVHKFGGIGK